MTRQEVTALLAVLRAAYPRFYSGMTRAELEGIVSLWADLFAADDAATVMTAAKAMIATDTKGYPPHIGALKEQVRKLATPDGMTAMEAWRLVKSAAEDGYYNAEARFAALPELCQRLVGSPAQLRRWALMDADTVDSVIGSNFQRSYQAAVKGEHELTMLPPDVRRLVEGARKEPKSLEAPR